MSLKQQQDLLARLYTDASFRARFFAGPALAAAELGIDADEANAIAAASREELDFFSESLFQKRLREVGNLLPLTKRELGDAFRDHFRVFAGDFVPRSVRKHVEDAVAYCDFLKRHRLARTTAGYESARLRFDILGKRVVAGFIAVDPQTGAKRTIPRPFLCLRIGRRRIVI